MQLIGITGGSGGGKSTVGALFEKYGFYYIDTDLIARAITEKDKSALKEIYDNFGNVFFEDGTLNRKSLGKIVFSDKAQLDILNRITHKYITSEVLEIIEKIRAENKYDGVIIDGAALIESGINKLCDKNIFVTADKEIRIKRIIDRDHISHEEALLRINGQMNDSYYKDSCDLVIDTGVSIEELSENIKNLAKELKRG